MKTRQIDPDEAIGRVLHGLAGVEAPPGFEREILRAVQQRVAEREKTILMTAWPWPPSRLFAVAAGLAIFAILALSMSIAMRRRHEPSRTAVALEQHAWPTPSSSPPPGGSEPQPSAKPQPVAFSALPQRKSPKPEVVSDQDALAISEMLAPSKPAPPLPLTHQERLLAEAAHQPSPMNLSSLRPEVRDKQMEMGKAEFRDFFDPPPAKSNE